jgi:SAM-dependent methyltransferase
VLDQFAIEPCRVLNPGCGNGKSAVWLARRGFDVVGIDLSPTAINQARERARAQQVSGRTAFYQGHFPDDLTSGAGDAGSAIMEDPLRPASFDLIVERAFLQHVGSGKPLSRTVNILAEALAPSGLFYSLMVASEGASGYRGIVRWSEKQIRSVLEPRFDILDMTLDVFTPGEPGSVTAWLTVMQPNR